MSRSAAGGVSEDLGVVAELIEGGFDNVPDMGLKGDG